MISHYREEEEEEEEEEEQEANDPVPTPSDTESGPYSGTEMTDEEIKNFYSTKYKHVSRPPMKAPLTAPLDIRISNADVEKLKVGLRTYSMDDKWDFLIEDPDREGNVSLHVLRSWLGKRQDCYVLHVAAGSGNDGDGDGGNGEGGEGAKVVGITWEGDKAGLRCEAEQAKIEAVTLCRGHLGCEFENLPDYPASMFWKNYKRLDAE